jgi:hypothetical protein
MEAAAEKPLDITVEKNPIEPPRLRGWFHLGATPVVIIASLVLFILSKESLKFAVALYSLTTISLLDGLPFSTLLSSTKRVACGY